MIKIENNKIYTKSPICEKTHIFEIVEKIPAGFHVWNIGENMGTCEFIPVCEKLYPEDKEDYSVNTSTLKAVKADFLKTVTSENLKGDFEKWKFFCGKKADCMRLGVRI